MNVQRGSRVRLVPNFAEHLMKWLVKAWCSDEQEGDAWLMRKPQSP